MTPRRARLLGRLGALLLRTLGVTWRVRRTGDALPSDHGSFVFAFWHCNMLLPAWLHRASRAAVLISLHGDGEVIAQVVGRLGFVPVRGSSTRGGARAYLEMLRTHGQRILAITPDGPKGPRCNVQEGVIQLAADTGRVIIPASYAVGRAKRLSSWDRFVIPTPFTRVGEHIGPPLAVPKRMTAEQRTELARTLEARFAEGTALAEESLRR